MPHTITLSSLLLCALLGAASTQPSTDAQWAAALAEPAGVRLARPTVAQFDWQETEMGMFLHLGPTTLQGGEYDNGTTALKDIRFEKLDVNQWCEAAKSFGAGHILLAAAHSGGFCLWPSKTTNYHIGNTSYRGGGGDIVKELAAACRQHGLKVGFHIWLPRPTTAGEDRNTVGYTKIDIARTWEDSNRLLAARFDELMDRLGADLVREIWIDQPIKSAIGARIAERAPHAVIAAVGSRDPLPTVRWPGNERGTVRYPCWSTLNRAQINQEVPDQNEADRRQVQGVEDPDGDYWAPQEADVPLHDHFWHMRPGALENRRSVEMLMDCYEASVGRNSYLLLNCCPQADGSVHPDDMKRYAEFGAEIKRRFGSPHATLERVAAKEVVLDLGGRRNVGYVDLWEDYRYGHRIRAFVIEGFDGTKWTQLFEGTAVGRRLLVRLPSTELTQVRVRVTQSVGTPLIRRLRTHNPK